MTFPEDVTVCCASNSQMYFITESSFTETPLKSSFSWKSLQKTLPHSLSKKASPEKKDALLEDPKSTHGTTDFTELIQFSGKWPEQAALQVPSLPCSPEFHEKEINR